jgi:hypothetical protein
MADICWDTARRIYQFCKAEKPEDDPEETVTRIKDEVHTAMFQAGYCRPRCESKDCEQVDGGHAT